MAKNNVARNRYLLMTTYFTTTFGFSLFVPLFATYVVNFGQNPERASFLWATYTLMFGTAVIIIGNLQDKLSHRSYRFMLALGYLLRLMATCVFIVSMNSFSFFAAGLLLYGLGSATLTPSWYSIMQNRRKAIQLLFGHCQGAAVLYLVQQGRQQGASCLRLAVTKLFFTA
jgi:MFS family permease